MDYIYFPLSKRVSKKWQHFLAIIFVFSLIGLWHGAAWNFILFGICSGVALVTSELTASYRKKVRALILHNNSTFAKRLYRGLQILIIFHLYVFIACVIFRSNSISDIFIIYKNMFSHLSLTKTALALPAFSFYEIMIAVAAITFLEICQWKYGCRPERNILNQTSLPFQWLAIYLLLFGILMFGEFNLTPFIYFQF